MAKIQSYVRLRPEETIGYCVGCNKLVHRTKKAECENGHPEFMVHGAYVLKEGEEMPQLPRFNWGAFFMPPIWGPAYGAWAGIIVLPLWLFTDSVLRSAVYTIGPNAALSAKIVTYGLAVLLPILTVALMAWVASRGWGFAWRRTFKTGYDKVTFKQFKKRQYVWAVISLVLFITLMTGAVYYWINVLPAQMAGIS